ncbi:MAG TPA: hypothetical protein PKA13_08865 [Geminicoccaceae bacterium]|nr:hypothetical protein [Geminicoccus sp.]HMU49875.1 hypothetical protein [Geminicoccaceae bacterium]
MQWIVSGLLAVAGVLAALFVARDSGNFPLVQAAVAIMLVVVAVGLVVIWRRRS